MELIGGEELAKMAIYLGELCLEGAERDRRSQARSLETLYLATDKPGSL